MDNPAVRVSCHDPKPAGKDYKPTLLSLSAKVEIGKQKVHKKVHVSELLRYEGGGDPTLDLLPDDDLIMASGIKNPEQPEQWEFKTHGPKTEVLRGFLEKNRKTFSTELNSGEPASVTPMKMDVDYESFKADKRSREPTRVQSALRNIEIAKWARKAVANNILRPSQAKAWSQLMLTKNRTGRGGLLLTTVH